MKNKQTNNRLFWILAIISFVYIFSTNYYIHHLLECSTKGRSLGALAVSSGDTFSYLGSIDNYIVDGTYYFKNMKGEKSYAGRMPFYGLPYYIFRIFLPNNSAYDALVLLQIILYSLSVPFLAFLAYNISKNRTILWTVFITYLLSTYTSTWVLSLSTESFATSFLIFFIFYYQKYYQSKNNKHLFISSVNLSLLVVLRPYFVFLYLFIGIDFILQTWNITKVAKKTIIASIPLLILLTPWIIRNYIYLHKFIPLQESVTAGYGYSKSELSCRRFITAWGGDYTSWEPKSAGCYFIKNEGIACQYSLPEDAISKSYTKQDVERVRSLFFKFQDKNSDSLDVVVSKKFDELTDKYISDKPFHYYVVNSIKRLKGFVIQSNTYNLPIHVSFPCYNTIQGAFKIFQYCLYYLMFVMGVTGMSLYFIKHKHFKNVSSLLFLPYLYVLILFPFVLGNTEWRFMTQVFPLLILWFGLLLAYFSSSLSRSANETIDSTQS